jgi:hypothetical protein
MSKSIDFSKGIRGKHSRTSLEVVGAVENVWAVCLSKTDENLIPFKIYKIEISSKSEKIKVKNEKGETLFYPQNWFAPLNISQNIIGLIEQAT